MTAETESRAARIAEIEERHARATPGTWETGPYGTDIWTPSERGGNTKIIDIRGWGYFTGKGGGGLGLSDEEALRQQIANGQFVACAHQDIPWLLAENARLQAELSAAEQRGRETAGLMREGARAYETAVRKFWSTDAVPPRPPFCGPCSTDFPEHTPDCIVTRLRKAADELEGKT